jgi:hypothetical protein
VIFEYYYKMLANKKVITIMRFKYYIMTCHCISIKHCLETNIFYIKSILKQILLNIGQFMFVVILETTVETDYNGLLCIVDIKSGYHKINNIHDIMHITPKIQKDLMQQKEFLESCSDYFVKYINKVTIIKLGFQKRLQQ